MIRALLLLFLFVLPAFAQAPPVPPRAGHFECWNDSITEHFTCMSAKGSIVDVEAALSKLDAQKEAWGNGGADVPTDKYQGLLQEFSQAAQKAADETDGKCHPVEPIHRVCHLRQFFKQGDIDTYTLDCIP